MQTNPGKTRKSSVVKPGYQIVAMASSAGGVTALLQVVRMLPAEFPVGILIVQHLDPRHRSLMAEILSKKSLLRVKNAEEGDEINPGVIYIAPPNRHLLVTPDGVLSLSQAELVHFVRPSADLLFESVAAAYRERALAVVLTGTGSDGAMGVRAIKKVGGAVIAQDEESSEFFGMPGGAIQTGCVDFVLPLMDIAPALVTLVNTGDVE